MVHDIPSPNFDERPSGIRIDTVVLHATVLNSLAEVNGHFADPASKLSAHYTIDRDGTTVSHVSPDQRAWHAGQSKLMDGRTRVNDFSIGIELVNLNDGIDPYPEPQIHALRDLLRSLIARYPIQYIVTHAEIADPPGRKSDPAGFDLDLVSDLL